MSSKLAKIGSIPPHWEVRPLIHYLTRITYGFTNPMPDSEYGPWKITAKDVIDGKINYTTARHTTKEAFDELLTDKSRPNVGDILLTKDGSIGRVAVVDREDICINQSVALLQPKGTIDSYFLKYLLMSPYYQSVMEGDAHGTTIKHIYITRVDKMEIVVPPLQEQKQIAGILSALDEKIELNWQTNATLEAIAQAIFKEWFVNYNYPGATSELVESELGLIPAGWTEQPLFDYADYINGAAYRNIDFSSDQSGLPVIKIAELKYGVSNNTKFTTEILDSKYLLQTGDILFSWSGSPETSIDVFIWDGGDAWLNQHIFNVVPNPNFDKTFLFFLLRHLKPIFIETARNKQTTGLGHVTQNDLKRLRFVVPSQELRQQFHHIVSPIFDKLLQNNLQTRTLTDLRDGLLPRLMRGEIEV